MPAEVDANECTGCGACAGSCPNSAITIDFATGLAQIDAAECNDCASCIDECPSEAISVN